MNFGDIAGILNISRSADVWVLAGDIKLGM
jgi:hypothetical protein